jgi:signal transduction histidine kinase
VVTLEASKLFRQLNAQELDTLRGMAREQTYAPGQEIFKAGDAGDGLYVVKEGVVEISVLVGQQVRRVFSQVEPGDMFGEMAVIEDKPRSANAVARRGATVYLLPRAELLNLVEQSPGLALGLLREISSRLREFNQQYLREVLQAERLAIVGRFAGSIVHDLKNPLNIIGLTAEIAGFETTSATGRQKASANIRKQVDRISDMVGEILEFTRGPQPDVVLAPMDYGLFMQQVAEEIRPEAALKSVTLELDGPIPEAKLLLNPKRLRRVFYNLIHNAAEAMPEGGKVFVRVRAGAGEAVTEIEDSGPGIAPEVAGQLFEPFATYGKATGTGLGLSICKRIVEDHHGWISARNVPGRGAVFSFGLPLAGKS